jgi:ribonuclease E
MPNTARGGGVSRKIINASDRKRLKAIAQEMEVPEGMAVIVRTAGSERSKLEIKRDYEYLLRMWDTVRELTLQSSAPTLVYEEASLIKRSIRDLYSRDIDEVLVDGDEGYRLAKDYMRMLTPSHAKKVQPYKDPAVPLFYRYQVENQLDAMHQPVVQLKSGGYLVIGQTEALVAIDVNSGRATRERHIEETAVKTNLEAADEIARQLRLRDLAGLVVIDFIDMEESRNNFAVERRLKEALKNDRARIQVGRISAFGLLELSRQRLRPSLQESAFSQCPHCQGTGFIRSVESSAMAVLRAIEEEGIRMRSSEVTVWVPTAIALYLLNQKRDGLILAEQRYGFKVYLFGDDSLVAPAFRMERVRAEGRPEEGRILPPPPAAIQIVEDEAEDEEEDESGEETSSSSRTPSAAAAPGEEGESNQARRRRRRRRKRGRGDQPSQLDLATEGGPETEGESETGTEGEAPVSEEAANDGPIGETEEERNHRRRRGRRGGRRRNRPFEQSSEQPVDETKPFSRDDVADVFEAVELAELAALEAKSNPAVTEAVESSEAVPAEAEAAPARKRRAPARKKADTTAEEPAAEVPSAEGEAQPKRRRAPARKKAEPAIEVVAEAAPEPVVIAQEPVHTHEQAPAFVPTPEPALDHDVPPTPEPAPIVEQVPAGPPKKGWWNKLLS